MRPLRKRLLPGRDSRWRLSLRSHFRAMPPSGAIHNTERRDLSTSSFMNALLPQLSEKVHSESHWTRMHENLGAERSFMMPDSDVFRNVPCEHCFERQQIRR